MDVFSELRRHAGGNHPQKVKLNVVLAAITDVIHDRRGPGQREDHPISNTEYFAALMTALESNDSSSHAQEIMQLLTMVLPEVHDAVLRTKFDAVAHAMIRIMQSNEEDISLLRSSLVALGMVIQAQEPSASVWNHPTTLKYFHVLLALAADPRPKIRKAAQSSIVKILEVHADAHCDTLSTHIASFAENILASAVAKDQTKVLQLVGFLGSVLPLLPGKVVTSLTEALLKLLQTNQKTLALVTLEAFDAVVVSPSSRLSAECLTSLLTTVLSLDSNIHDQQHAILLIQITCRALARLEPLQSTRELLPRVVVAMCTYFESQHTQVHRKCAELLNVALQACLTLGPHPSVQRVLFSLEGLLTLRYQHAWSSIFSLLTSIVGFYGENAHPAFDSIFSTTVDLYAAMDSMPQAHDDMRKWFTRFLTAATTSVGAEVMLSVVPLQNDHGIVEERAWLIPVIRDAAKAGPGRLEYFSTAILSLAKTCEAVARADSTTALESKRMQARTMQLWSLFPSFCTHPTDIAGHFKKIAKTLANAMSDKRYPELQLLVCQGLQALLKAAAAAAKSEDDDPSDVDQAALAKFAARFLPLLIAIVEGLDADTESDRLQTLLDTITNYATLAEPEFVQNVFKQLMQTLLQTTTAAKKSADPKAPAAVAMLAQAHLHMSIALALVGIIDVSQVALLYRVVKPYMLDDTDPVMQKRSYSVLVTICDTHPAFAAEHLTDMIESLSESLLTCSVPAKKMRLRCLHQIVRAIEAAEHPDTAFVPTLVGEIMLCTKEANAKAREAAFEVLLAMAKLLDAQGNLMDFIQMVLGGLAARTPHMRSASVLCLSRLVFEFGRTEVTIQQAMPDLLRTVLMLLHEKAREVIKSVIGFLKLGIAILPKEALVEFLPSIVNGLLQWIGESKARFRAKTRTIMMKLCRKFGYEYVASLVPEADRKLITHIRKTKEREDREKEQKRESRGQKSFEEFMQDSDDDDSGHEGGAATTKSSKGNDAVAQQRPAKKIKTANGASNYIKENAEEDIVDFLDNAAFKNIVPSRKAKRVESDDEFEIAKDGRMIIPGIPDDDDDDDAMGDSEDEDAVRRDVQKKLANMGLDKKRKRDAAPAGPTAGNEYRAKKASGDVKKQGKVDPYAYIPLDPKLMARRNKHSAVSKFSKTGRVGKQRK
ncbi:hypothetical protein DYB38_002852 [Aphanomyces astaci]|uniref:Uncharacterized protein n=2 Tax=Aphanomyces astaci TaxID=112090 RepID=A0A397FDH1_APHAT|nr:hypothetical protein DYB38_002852 [Aphanomyces astaci]RHZ19294.1 hypothetical protein DYB31_007666 [Aphanomyces astaci]